MRNGSEEYLEELDLHKLFPFRVEPHEVPEVGNHVRLVGGQVVDEKTHKDVLLLDHWNKQRERPVEPVVCRSPRHTAGRGLGGGPTFFQLVLQDRPGGLVPVDVLGQVLVDRDVDVPLRPVHAPQDGLLQEKRREWVGWVGRAVPCRAGLGTHQVLRSSLPVERPGPGAEEDVVQSVVGRIVDPLRPLGVDGGRDVGRPAANVKWNRFQFS